MGRRISGLLLMVRALAPILIVLVIGVAGWIVLSDVRAAVDPPLATIRGEIGEIRETVGAVRDDLTAVNAEITSLVSALQAFSIPNLIPNIPGNLSFPSLNIPNVNIPIPSVSVRTSSTNIAGVNISYPSGINVGSTSFNLDLPNIPGFSVPLPGLGDVDDLLRSGLSGITSVFDAFDTAFSSIGDLNATLQAVPEHFSTITTQTENLVTNIRGVLTRWGETLLIVMVILLALVMIYLGVPLLDDLTRGWRLLRGLEAD